jgi:hypothetical protein
MTIPLTPCVFFSCSFILITTVFHGRIGTELWYEFNKELRQEDIHVHPKYPKRSFKKVLQTRTIYYAVIGILMRGHG